MATLSSILAWEIPWTGEPRELQFTGSQRVYMIEQCTHKILPYTFLVAINMLLRISNQSSSTCQIA